VKPKRLNLLTQKILQAARISELQEACGVTPRPQRPLTAKEQKVVAWFRAELQAAYDEELAKLRAAAQTERAKLARLLARDDESKQDQID
jgi:hypothetical protein